MRDEVLFTLAKMFSDKFQQKMNLEISVNPSFSHQVNNIDPIKNVEFCMLINELPNTVEIIKHMNENPEVFACLLTLSEKAPALAQQQLEKVSKFLNK